MIAQVKTSRQRQRFFNACREKLCLGATMPLALSLFGKSQPGRFFAGPTLALDVGGSTAWLAGHANPDELAGFLNFCGCEAVVLDEAGCPPPTGWKRAKTLSVFGLPPGRQLPLPEADAAPGRASKRTLSLRPERQRRCSSPTAPANGMTFTLSCVPSAAGALPGSGRWNGRGRSSAPWEPMRWRMGRPIWPAARRPRPCGARHRRAAHRWDGQCPLGRGVDARLPVQPRAGAFLYPTRL